MMHISVLIEPLDNRGYRASTGQPLTLTAEGSTREEALGQLRQAVQHRLSAGAEIAALELNTPAHPLVPYAGMFKDNPLFDAWQQAMADYRQQKDGDEGNP